jgi:hypothetical protein
MILRLAPPALGTPSATLLRFARLVALWYAAANVVPGLAVAAAEAWR